MGTVTFYYERIGQRSLMHRNAIMVTVPILLKGHCPYFSNGHCPDFFVPIFLMVTVPIFFPAPFGIKGHCPYFSLLRERGLPELLDVVAAFGQQDRDAVISDEMQCADDDEVIVGVVQ